MAVWTEMVAEWTGIITLWMKVACSCCGRVRDTPIDDETQD